VPVVYPVPVSLPSLSHAKLSFENEPLEWVTVVN
jgi:hypothetical protein